MATSGHGALSNDVVLQTLNEVLNNPNELRSHRGVTRQWFVIFNNKAIQVSTIQGLKRIVSPFPDGLDFGRSRLPIRHVVFENIRRVKVDDQVKFLEDVEVVDFFRKLGNQLKFLSFKSAEEESMTAVHLRFLENVLYKWCSNLEELNLIEWFENGIEIPDESEHEKVISLKKLVMDYANTEFTAENMLMSVIRKLIIRANRLESFIYIGYKLDPLLHSVPSEMMRQMNTNLRNLTTLELWDANIGEAALSLITQAGWPLKRFVYEGKPLLEVRIRHLNLFLDAHTKTLKYLHFVVHWITYFTDHNVELNVHTLTNLEVLKIAVQNINVGGSGLIGNLKNLRHLTIWGSSAEQSAQHDIETMFREKISTSLKSLVMDKTYARQIASIRQYCPNVRDLEISFLVKNVDVFIGDLNVVVGDVGILEDLKVTAIFEDFDIHNDDFVRSLIVGIFRHAFRVMTLTTSNEMDNFPWLRVDWIQDGLLTNVNTYYRIEFKRFVFRDDELENICRILSDRANFVTLVDCKVKATNLGDILDVDEVTFFKDNVGEVITNIISEAQKRITGSN